MITAQGHPVMMVTRAKEHRAAGWSCKRAAEMLNEEFEPAQPVSRATVYRWTGKGKAAAYAERERKRKLLTAVRVSGGRLGQAHHSSDYQEQRVSALAMLGMPYSQLVTIMAFDYPGQGWTRSRIEALLGPAKQRRDERASGSKL